MAGHAIQPMHYPTHSTGIVVPIAGERLVEVEAVGWGDGHEVLATNQYKNPFWNTTGLFKTSVGHCSRISVFWHVATGGTERGSIYGNLMSYIMERPEGSPDTVITISKDGKTVIDANGYPEGDVKIEAHKELNHWELLPPSMRVPTSASKRMRRHMRFCSFKMKESDCQVRSTATGTETVFQYFYAEEELCRVNHCRTLAGGDF